MTKMRDMSPDADPARQGALKTFDRYFIARSDGNGVTFSRRKTRDSAPAKPQHVHVHIHNKPRDHGAERRQLINRTLDSIIHKIRRVRDELPDRLSQREIREAGQGRWAFWGNREQDATALDNRNAYQGRSGDIAATDRMVPTDRKLEHAENLTPELRAQAQDEATGLSLLNRRHRDIFEPIPPRQFSPEVKYAAQCGAAQTAANLAPDPSALEIRSAYSYPAAPAATEGESESKGDIANLNAAMRNFWANKAI